MGIFFLDGLSPTLFNVRLNLFGFEDSCNYKRVKLSLKFPVHQFILSDIPKVSIPRRLG